MLKNPKDTYHHTHQAIARNVLAHPLASHVAGSGRSRLEASAAGTEDLDNSFFSFFSVEFHRAGTNCHLDIRNVSKRTSVTRQLDADGNEWDEYELQCTVNHPCHGSADPATTLARLALYHDVAMLAAEIQAEFPGCMRMTRTKGEIERDEIKARQLAMQRKVINVVEACRKNMRKGSSVGLAANNVEGIDCGEYEVWVDAKLYKLEVFNVPPSHGCPAMVSRTK